MNRRQYRAIVVLAAATLPGWLYAAPDAETAPDAGKSHHAALRAFFKDAETRWPGSPGNREIEARVAARFAASGLPHGDISFQAPSFIPGKAHLELADGQRLRLRAMHPSLFRPGNFTTESCRARLVYLGRGTMRDLAALKGIDLSGTLALMDFDCGSNWLRFLRFGVKGFVFVGQDRYNTDEAWLKVHDSEVAVPRYFVSAADGARLVKRLRPPGSFLNVTVTAEPSRWRNVTLRDLYVLLPGADPELQKDVILLIAPMDSNCVVPELAVGGRAGMNLFLLLHLFESFRNKPPARSVLFVATNAHTQGFYGERMLAWHLLAPDTRVAQVRDTLAESIKHDQLLLEHYDRLRLDAAPEEARDLFVEFRHLEDRSTGKTIKIKAPIVALAKRDVNQTKGQMLQVQRTDLPEPEKEALLETLRARQEKYVNVLTLFNKVGIQTELDDLGREEKEILGGYVETIRTTLRTWTELNWRDLKMDSANGAVRTDVGARKVRVVISLNLCVRGNQIGFCSANQLSRSNWAARLGVNSVRVARSLDWPGPSPFLDTMTNYAGLPEGYYFPLTLAGLDYFHAANTAAVALRTAFQDMGETFTPGDTFERVDPDTLEMLCGYLPHYFRALLNDRTFTASSELPAPGNGAFWSVQTRTFKFDEFAASVLPEIPVPDTAVIIYPYGATNEPARDGDVVNRLFMITDARAACMFYGLNTRSRYTNPVAAFHFDPDFTTVEHVIDAGNAYEKLGTRLFQTPSITFALFRCREFPLYNREDPSKVSFMPITVDTYFCLDASQDAAPRKYGMTGVQSGLSAMAMPEKPTGPGAFYTDGKSSIKVLTNTKRTALNADEKSPLGRGFDKADAPDPDFFVTACEDMGQLNQHRLEKLRGVTNELVQIFMARARAALARVRDASLRHDHLEYLPALAEALGSRAKAYEQISSITNDMLKAVVCYMALLLPFCFFVQKLFFKFVKLEVQLGVFAVLFVAMFLVFRHIHPAFKVAQAPEAIFIGFVMGALGLFVISILHRHFEGEMQLLFLTYTGLDSAEVGYSTVGQKAMLIGVNNMKRRRVRTALTTGTIVLVTFTMLAFSSVSKKMSPTVVSVTKDVKYTGLFYHWPGKLCMDEATARVFAELFAGQADEIVVRRWLLPPPKSYYIDPFPFHIETDTGHAAHVDAVLGLPVADNGFLGPMPLLPESRFFSRNDAWEAVLPAGTARVLGLAPTDVGQVDLLFRGHRFKLVGLVDDERLRVMRDLNNRPILPITEIERSLNQSEAAASLRADPTAQDESAIFYVDTSALLLLPVETARKLGAAPYSVSIRFPEDTPVWEPADLLLTCTEAKFFIGSRKPFSVGAAGTRMTMAGIYYVGSGYRTSIGGLSRLIIPLLIAGTIILNTMLGSVYERRNEIAVYNAVGLNPTHIGFFFLAEAFVYSVIGSVGGYLIGQVLTLIITRFDLVGGINLNFSSLSVVYVILFTISIVLLSTLYPAAVATRAAVPSGKRKWSMPEPDDQEMRIVFPFIYQPDLAPGIMAYIETYLGSFTEASMGTMIATLDSKARRRDAANRHIFRLDYTVALAPFDLGVTQRARFVARYDDIVNSYRVHLTITRLSGQDANWMTTNKPFLERLRQYLLHWRNLPAATHASYCHRALTLFGAAPEPAAAPGPDNAAPEP